MMFNSLSWLFYIFCFSVFSLWCNELLGINMGNVLALNKNGSCKPHVLSRRAVKQNWKLFCVPCDGFLIIFFYWNLVFGPFLWALFLVALTIQLLMLLDTNKAVHNQTINTDKLPREHIKSKTIVEHAIFLHF
jgi:hypothetical protein